MFLEHCSLCLGYRPTLKIYGKDVIQSRQVAVFAIEKERAQMKYSNHDAKVDHPFPDVIKDIAVRLKEVSTSILRATPTTLNDLQPK